MKYLLIAILVLTIFVSSRNSSEARSTKIDGGSVPDEPVCGYVWALDQPMIPVPCDIVSGISEYIMDCEIKGWWATWATPADVISATGDYGAFQVNLRIHGPRMRSMGLDPYSEHDRVWYAINVLYAESGWPPWYCSHAKGSNEL